MKIFKGLFVSFCIYSAFSLIGANYSEELAYKGAKYESLIELRYGDRFSELDMATLQHLLNLIDNKMTTVVGDDEGDLVKKQFKNNIYSALQNVVEKYILAYKEKGIVEAKILINSYYNKIAAGELETAYSMKYDSTVSFEVFKKNYYKDLDKKEIWNGVKYDSDYLEFFIYGFDKISDDTYVFKINLLDRSGLENVVFEKYKIVMSVTTDKKLETISVENLKNEIIEIATNGNFSVFYEWNIDKGEKIYLNEGNITYIIDETLPSIGLYISPSDAKFLNSGSDIIYSSFSDEVFSKGNYLYNLESGKSIELFQSNIIDIHQMDSKTMGLTKNNNYFYNCSEGYDHGFSAGLKIYNYPELVLVNDLFDLRDDYGNIIGGPTKCLEYTNIDNIFRYEDEKGVQEYSFN